MKDYFTLPFRTMMTRKNRLPRNTATYSGLEHWIKHEYKHLGLMLMAKARGMNTKVKAYKESVHSLVRAIKKSMSEYKNSDKKRDLKIMLSQAELLERHMNDIL